VDATPRLGKNWTKRVPPASVGQDAPSGRGVTSMAFVLIEHRTDDFETFKAVFLEDADRRRRFGSLGGHVLRVFEAPDAVFVLLEWDTVDRARDFALSLELHQAAEWSASGISTPRVVVLERAVDIPF
jgi:hypothetical protein